MYREERYTDAIQVMTEALAMLGDAESGIHRSVLLNNLGRVHAVVDGHEKEAERTLRAAIAIDPTFAEYHLDLAMLLTRCQRYPEAVEAADAAWSCSTTIAEIPALLGYLHAQLGDHGRAADEYGRAARLRPGKQEHLIAAAREACEAGDYPLTRRWLLRLDRSELTDDQRAEADLLLLEADLDAAAVIDRDAVLARLRRLARQYPESDLVRQNIAALESDDAEVSDGVPR